MANDQGAAHAVQFSMQFIDACQDELHPAALAGKRGKDFLVEDENAEDRPALLECMIKRRMIESTQIPMEPYKGFI